MMLIVARPSPRLLLQRCFSTLAASPPSPPPLYSSVLETIGNTPLVRLDRLCRALELPPTTSILAKCEHLNPGMSKKDRIALEIIRQAQRTGELQDGQPVVELTSGNTGTGLAIVCQQLGHPFWAVMSQGNSKERAQMMRGLGARVELVPQASQDNQNQVSGEDLALVEVRAQELVQEMNAFRVDQFHRSANWEAHYHGTALEILEQTRGVATIDGFCDFVGTGGSFAGCTMRFKEELGADNVKCYILEPKGAKPLADKYGPTLNSEVDNKMQQSNQNHVIQGGGYNMSDLPLIDDVLEKCYVDGYMQVSNSEATQTARLLAQTEGIFGGFSAGANLQGAANMILQGIATNVVAIVCDSGSKYFSARLLPDLEEEREDEER